VRHKSINTPSSQDGGRGTHVTHFVQLYPQPLYTASQVRTTCRSWDEGVLTDLCLTLYNNFCCVLTDSYILYLAELNPICHLLPLHVLRAHHILHVSRIRVNYCWFCFFAGFPGLYWILLLPWQSWSWWWEFLGIFWRLWRSLGAQGSEMWLQPSLSG